MPKASEDVLEDEIESRRWMMEKLEDRSTRLFQAPDGDEHEFLAPGHAVWALVLAAKFPRMCRSPSHVLFNSSKKWCIYEAVGLEEVHRGPTCSWPLSSQVCIHASLV